MAVVAVGDFDVAAMESRIVEAFGDIDGPGQTRSWDPVTFTPADAPLVGSHTDEEATSSEVSVIWPVFAGPIATVGEYQEVAMASMAVEILTQRLADDALSGEGPLLDASAINLDWARAIGLLGVDAEVRPEQTDQGLEAVLHEVERVRRHGITEAEFDRAVRAFEATIRQLFETQDTIQDTEFASQIAAHHLGGDPMMSPSQRFDVESDIAARITEEDVERTMIALMSRPPVVLALGPDDPGVEVPSEERILEVLDGLAQVTLEPRAETPLESIDLMSPPSPADVVRNTIHPEFLYTRLEFANGADVYLWESDIATQGVYALVEGFGGTSVLPVEDLPEAFLVTDMVLRSGLGELNATTLDRVLADRLVSLQPWISETRQGLEGNASTVDVETLMQLINLTMTRPRLDVPAVEAVLDETSNIAVSRDDLPGVMFDEAITRAYYGDDPRYFVVPSPDQLAGFDVADAERVFRERFANAGDFAFVFVGDFETAAMIDLAARYIGTLPGGQEAIAYVDNQPLPPREVQVATVEAGTGQQGQIGLFFTNEHDPVLKDRVAARLVELVLTARLRERIREGLSATYSITASIDLQRDPDPFAEASIISTGDPSGLDQISEEIMSDIRSLQADGPTETQFETAIEQLRNELELIDNLTIATALVTAHLYPDQPVTELSARYSLLEEITPADVQAMAAIAFNPDQRIEVRQIPKP
jgi:zinc protease